MLFGLVLSCCSLPCGAEASSLSVLLEHIEVDAIPASQLLVQGEFDGLRASVAKLESEGRAKVREVAYIRTRPQQRSRLEAHHELICPTEYEPGGFGQLPEPPNIPPGALTAFEMRPVGATMEIDAILGVDGVADLNLAYEQVRFIRMVDYGHGEALAVQPVFETSSITTALALAPGEEVLVGAFTPRAEKDGGARSERIVLILARSDVGS